MKKHVKIYLDYYGYCTEDIIICQYCKSDLAVDIHHIDQKKMGGKRYVDKVDNLIALCRKCHEKAHAYIITKEEMIKLL